MGSDIWISWSALRAGLSWESSVSLISWYAWWSVGPLWSWVALWSSGSRDAGRSHGSTLSWYSLITLRSLSSCVTLLSVKSGQPWWSEWSSLSFGALWSVNTYNRMINVKFRSHCFRCLNRFLFNAQSEETQLLFLIFLQRHLALYFYFLVFFFLNSFEFWNWLLCRCHLVV